MKARLLVVGGALAMAIAAAATQAAALDLSRDIDARGAKPAWTLKVRGTQFTLSRPGKPDVAAAAPGAAISPTGASWSAKAADGQPLNVALFVKPCNLGQAQYPMTAQVTLGAEAMSGCAGYSR